MRPGGAPIVVLMALTLMLLFTVFNIGGMGLGSLGEGGLGAIGRATVSFRVELIDEEGVKRPVKDAEVVVGLESRLTDQSGKTEMSLPPGVYSSYVRIPGQGLAPLLTKLEVSGEMSVDVIFEVRRMRPSSVSLESDGNSTYVVMEIEVPQGIYRAYMAEPVLGLLSGDGIYVAVNQENKPINAFTIRLEPNSTRRVESIVSGHMALLDLRNTYIPVELIRVNIMESD